MSLSRLALWFCVSFLWIPSAFSRVYSWKAAVLETYQGKQWLNVYVNESSYNIKPTTTLTDIYNDVSSNPSPLARKIDRLISLAIKKAKSASQQFGVTRKRLGLTNIESHFVSIACFSIGQIDEHGIPIRSNTLTNQKISVIDEKLIESLNVDEDVKSDIRHYLKFKIALENKRDIAFRDGDSTMGVSDGELDILDSLFEDMLDSLGVTYDSDIYTNNELGRDIKIFWIDADEKGADVNKFVSSLTERHGAVETVSLSPSLMVLEGSVAQYRESMRLLYLPDQAIFSGKVEEASIHEIRHAYFARLRSENRDSLHSGLIDKHIVEELPLYHPEQFSLEELDTWLGDLHHWSSRYLELTDYRSAIAREVRSEVITQALFLRHLSLQTSELSKQFLDGYNKLNGKRTKIIFEPLFDVDDRPLGVSYIVTGEVASLYYYLLGPEHHDVALDIINSTRGSKRKAETAIIDRIKLIHEYSNSLFTAVQEIVKLASQKKSSKQAVEVKNKVISLKTYSNPFVSFTGSRCRTLFE